MSNRTVPFMDLARQHQMLHTEINEAVSPLLGSASFVGGEPVARFEQAFAEAHAIPHAVTVKSGTAALHLALTAMGIGPEDEVIVPAYTFIATAAAVAHTQATPVFVDVDPTTACMDPEAVVAAVTSRTRALIPVHLYGHPAPMEELSALAREHGLRILEDCAQSHFGTLNGTKTGTLGDAGAFSFYPSKNLGAGGDAGCVVTCDEALAETVRRLANHGRSGRYDHDALGWNERLDAVQAAILEVKLRHLSRWTEQRRRAAARYRQLLSQVSPWGEPLVLPVEQPGASHVYHLYVVRHSRRDDIARALADRGVGTATHYPRTLPAQPAFRSLNLGEGSYPVSENWAGTCLSLPLFPEIEAWEQEQVADSLRSLAAR
jgi:dTDP-4-amino-4,6-dideoxygalactose transaminase